jgi:hypothetical protein
MFIFPAVVVAATDLSDDVNDLILVLSNPLIQTLNSLSKPAITHIVPFSNCLRLVD